MRRWMGTLGYGHRGDRHGCGSPTRAAAVAWGASALLPALGFLRRLGPCPVGPRGARPGGLHERATTHVRLGQAGRGRRAGLGGKATFVRAVEGG
jgi:hypothetical protein